ncbi:TetR/AcrR family transcriptional regulator [Actinomyces vulturis]|uniref:TetR/AcrR family transcriptional regulator n=1 Tax=Actinomyces vulturis TaxID=1857645 RepID=UPI000AD5AAB8|nr:TetR family transcriptional regulator [Actinomyces vulturis]
MASTPRQETIPSFPGYRDTLSSDADPHLTHATESASVGKDVGAVSNTSLAIRDTSHHAVMTSPEYATTGNTGRGIDRKQALVNAAAEIIRELGPAAVSHRAVAKRAACSLSATTYYFNGLDDLLYQAGQVNIGMWASRAEAVAERVEQLSALPDLPGRVELVLAATLPAEGPYFGHYAQLLSAGTSAPVGRAYRDGRLRLNSAVTRVLVAMDSPLNADMVIAIVDGAAVTALSEGRDVRATATDLLMNLTRQAYAARTTL